MDSQSVKNYFESSSVVEHYAQATAHLGLWKSEEKILTRVFDRKDSLIELGCGAGRIAFGLYELGFKNILATDYSKAMIQQVRHFNKLLEYAVPSKIADATRLEFEDDVFDGAIFGFNGLMQIPEIAQREQALREILRVVRPGSWFVFTTHDREHSQHVDFWIAEEKRWGTGTQSKGLECFGDRFSMTDDGIHFMHVPSQSEMEAILEKVGFHIEASILRSDLASESKDVLVFSDECRFWVVQKPI